MILFDFIIKKKFNELKEYIDANPDADLDVYDLHHNYFIQYLVLYNLIDIIKYIVKNRTIRLDIVDTDGRNLLYTLIKYNYIELLELLIEIDKNNIGLSIINIRDNLGYCGLHYSVIFNNMSALKILYQAKADLTILDNESNNIFTICFQYKRTEILLYLLENELKSNINISVYINHNGESILHSAITYDNTTILDYIINQKQFITMLVNRTEKEYGLSALHQCVVLNKNTIAFQLLELGADINSSDYIGNTPIHYAMIEKNFQFIEDVVDKYDITRALNISNLNGDTPLHIFLENSEISVDIVNSKYQYNYLHILEKILEKTNINSMNNTGITPLHLIVNKNLWTIDSIKTILTNGTTHMNLFITSNNNNTAYDIVPENMKKDFINIAVDSYYNILKKIKNKDELSVEWEKYCASDDLTNLMTLYNKDKKSKDKSTSEYCKEYIRDVIVSMKRSIPLYHEITLNIDSGLFVDGCYYTGSSIDILFGLVYLYTEFNASIVLEYPLTENKELEKYYKKIGLNYSYKLDFSNIEIIWSFQKIIYMVNFDMLFLAMIDSSNQFIVIPLGIEVANGSHANILIIDTKNKTIERFEPNGKNNPRDLYYNAELLDTILINKFNELIPRYSYLKPSDFLPDIGFQILETLDNEKCTRLGDPNGFCAVWCVWWAEQRVTNPNIKPDKLTSELIRQIRFANKSFKNLIRNYSMKIIKTRDMYLKKYNLDINDWVLNNYTEDTILKIEKKVLEAVGK
jgi:ankyrin repeat protein